MAGLCPQRNRVRSVLDSRVEASEYASDISMMLRDFEDKIEFVLNFKNYVLSIVPKPPYEYIPLTYGLTIHVWSKRRDEGCRSVV